MNIGESGWAAYAKLSLIVIAVNIVARAIAMVAAPSNP